MQPRPCYSTPRHGDAANHDGTSNSSTSSKGGVRVPAIPLESQHSSSSCRGCKGGTESRRQHQIFPATTVLMLALVWTVCSMGASGQSITGLSCGTCTESSTATITGTGFDSSTLANNNVTFQWDTANNNGDTMEEMLEPTCTMVSATTVQLTCTLSLLGGASGTWSVYVTVSGTVASNGGTYSASMAPTAPTTTAISSGCSGGTTTAATGCVGNTAITISGTTFSVVPYRNSVTLSGGTGNTPQCYVGFSTATSLVCTLFVPAATTGAWDVSVSTHTTSSNTNSLPTATVQGATPVVTGVAGPTCTTTSGSSVPTCSAGILNISGSYFSTDHADHTLSFSHSTSGGSISYSTVSSSNDWILFNLIDVPPGSGGTGGVIVNVASMSSGTGNVNFAPVIPVVYNITGASCSYNATVSNLYTTTPTCRGGSTVTINGKGFPRSSTYYSLLAVSFTGGFGTAPTCTVSSSDYMSESEFTCSLTVKTDSLGTWSIYTTVGSYVNTDTISAVLTPKVPKVFEITSGCTGGTTSHRTGCEDGTSIWVYGCCPESLEATYIKLVGGQVGYEGRDPTCTPTTLSGNDVLCRLSVPPGTSGNWRVKMVLGGVESDYTDPIVELTHPAVNNLSLAIFPYPTHGKSFSISFYTSIYKIPSVPLTDTYFNVTIKGLNGADLRYYPTVSSFPTLFRGDGIRVPVSSLTPDQRGFYTISGLSINTMGVYQVWVYLESETSGYSRFVAKSYDINLRAQVTPTITSIEGCYTSQEGCKHGTTITIHGQNIEGDSLVVFTYASTNVNRELQNVSCARTTYFAPVQIMCELYTTPLQYPRYNPFNLFVLNSKGGSNVIVAHVYQYAKKLPLVLTEQRVSAHGSRQHFTGREFDIFPPMSTVHFFPFSAPGLSIADQGQGTSPTCVDISVDALGEDYRCTLQCRTDTQGLWMWGINNTAGMSNISIDSLYRCYRPQESPILVQDVWVDTRCETNAKLQNTTYLCPVEANSSLPFHAVFEDYDRTYPSHFLRVTVQGKNFDTSGRNVAFMARGTGGGMPGIGPAPRVFVSGNYTNATTLVLHIEVGIETGGHWELFVNNGFTTTHIYHAAFFTGVEFQLSAGWDGDVAVQYKGGCLDSITTHSGAYVVNTFCENNGFLQFLAHGLAYNGSRVTITAAVNSFAAQAVDVGAAMGADTAGSTAATGGVLPRCILKNITYYDGTETFRNPEGYEFPFYQLLTCQLSVPAFSTGIWALQVHNSRHSARGDEFLFVPIFTFTPTITAVAGCGTGNSTYRHLCEARGTQSLTITGSNFLPSATTVKLLPTQAPTQKAGLALCTVLSATTSQLVCRPDGYETTWGNWTVVVSKKYGSTYDSTETAFVVNIHYTAISPVVLDVIDCQSLETPPRCNNGITMVLRGSGFDTIAALNTITVKAETDAAGLTPVITPIAGHAYPFQLSARVSAHWGTSGQWRVYVRGASLGVSTLFTVYAFPEVAPQLDFAGCTNNTCVDGTTVTVQGLNFDTIAARNLVTFQGGDGPVPTCTTHYARAREIRCTLSIPSQLTTGFWSVVVTTTGGSVQSVTTLEMVLHRPEVASVTYRCRQHQFLPRNITAMMAEYNYSNSSAPPLLPPSLAMNSTAQLSTEVTMSLSGTDTGVVDASGKCQLLIAGRGFADISINPIAIVPAAVTPIAVGGERPQCVNYELLNSRQLRCFLLGSDTTHGLHRIEYTGAAGTATSSFTVVPYVQSPKLPRVLMVRDCNATAEYCVLVGTGFDSDPYRNSVFFVPSSQSQHLVESMLNSTSGNETSNGTTAQSGGNRRTTAAYPPGTVECLVNITLSTPFVLFCSIPNNQSTLAVFDTVIAHNSRFDSAPFTDRLFFFEPPPPPPPPPVIRTVVDVIFATTNVSSLNVSAILSALEVIAGVNSRAGESVELFSISIRNGTVAELTGTQSPSANTTTQSGNGTNGTTTTGTTVSVPRDDANLNQFLVTLAVFFQVDSTKAQLLTETLSLSLSVEAAPPGVDPVTQEPATNITAPPQRQQSSGTTNTLQLPSGNNPLRRTTARRVRQGSSTEALAASLLNQLRVILAGGSVSGAVAEAFAVLQQYGLAVLVNRGSADVTPSLAPPLPPAFTPPPVPNATVAPNTSAPTWLPLPDDDDGLEDNVKLWVPLAFLLVVIFGIIGVAVWRKFFVRDSRVFYPKSLPSEENMRSSFHQQQQRNQQEGMNIEEAEAGGLMDPVFGPGGWEHGGGQAGVAGGFGVGESTDTSESAATTDAERGAAVVDRNGRRQKKKKGGRKVRAQNRAEGSEEDDSSDNNNPLNFPGSDAVVNVVGVVEQDQGSSHRGSTPGGHGSPNRAVRFSPNAGPGTADVSAPDDTGTETESNASPRSKEERRRKKREQRLLEEKKEEEERQQREMDNRVAGVVVDKGYQGLQFAIGIDEETAEHLNDEDDEDRMV